jgi:hypothetical protein
MLKQLSQLEHKIEERIYHFLCDPNSPLEHVEESLFQFISYVRKIREAVKVQQEQQKPESQDALKVDKPVDEQKVEGQ